MENVKSAVMAVCLISAAKCIIGSIAAASKLKNQLDMIMKLMLAVVMVSPFTKGFSDFELPDISDYEFSGIDYSGDIYAEALAEKAAENIESVLISQIEASGVAFEKIAVDVNISSGYSIFINRVTVTSEDFEAVAEIIRRSLGNETEVVNELA